MRWGPEPVYHLKIHQPSAALALSCVERPEIGVISGPHLSRKYVYVALDQGANA